MKIVTLIARVLLGLVFLVFGANKLVQFLPTPPMPTGLAGQFAGVLMATQYMHVIGLLEVVGGTLLLINRFVPLALTLLGPVVVNIFLFHAMMEPGELPLAIVVVLLWVLIFYRHRAAFSGLFQQRVPGA